MARIEGPNVIDERGTVRPIKEVLPVAPTSTKPLLLGRGLDLNRTRRKNALEAQRIELEDLLDAAGGEENIRTLSRQLRRTDFFETLRLEGIGGTRVFESFVGLFPTVFEFTGRGVPRGIRLK